MVRYRHRGTASIVDAHQWWCTVESEIHIANMVEPKYTTEWGANDVLWVSGGGRAIPVPPGW